VKKIPLGHGKYALVDDEDYDWLAQYRWQVEFKDGACYASRKTSRKAIPPHAGIYMHREIMQAARGEIVDHINHNGLDNRRSNLRKVTPSQSVMNRRKPRLGTNKYKGVRFESRSRANPWTASITVNRKEIYLGAYKTEDEAAAAYNQAAQEYFGEYAHLNQIGGD
jgi:hypothetical protein